MLYVYRNANNTGWIVSVRALGHVMNGYTSDAKCGGEKRAMRAAAEMRNRFIAEIRATEYQRGNTTARLIIPRDVLLAEAAREAARLDVKRVLERYGPVDEMITNRYMQHQF